MDASKLDKEMSGKGKKEAFPGVGKSKIDREAPEVKKKDAAQYKDINDMKKQNGHE